MNRLALNNKRLESFFDSKPFFHPSLKIPSPHFEHNNTNYVSGMETMGSWFSDLTNINIDFQAGLEHFLMEIANVFNRLGSEIGKIDWQQIGLNLQSITSNIAHVLYELNPYHLVYMGLSTNPLTEHAFRELDKFTGGALTSVENVSSLPARVVRGDAISKEELVSDALFILRVAAVATGTTTIVSAVSGQLARGTLGQTETGRSILRIAESAGIAYFTDTSVIQAATTTGVKEVAGAAQTEIIKNTEIGQTELGQLAIAGVFAVGVGEAVGPGAGEALSTYGETTAISQAGRVVPGGSQLAQYVINNGVTIPGSSGGTDGGGDWSLSSVIENLHLADIPGNIYNALTNISFGSSTGGTSMPDVEGEKPPSDAPAIQIPKGNLLDQPVVSVGPWQVDVGDILDFFLKKKGKKVMRRRRVKLRNGKEVWQYEFEDGSLMFADDQGNEIEEAFPILPFILVGTGLLLLLMPKRRT